MAENDNTAAGITDWRLPNGGQMFFAHDESGSFITSSDTDRHFGTYLRAWFSVRLRKGQWWLYFVVAAQLEDRVRVELPPTQEEALVWMRMVVEMSGIKQEEQK